MLHTLLLADANRLQRANSAGFEMLANPRSSRASPLQGLQLLGPLVDQRFLSNQAED
jgi:hypothetical protein